MILYGIPINFDFTLNIWSLIFAGIVSAIISLLALPLQEKIKQFIQRPKLYIEQDKEQEAKSRNFLLVENDGVKIFIQFRLGNKGNTGTSINNIKLMNNKLFCKSEELEWERLTEQEFFSYYKGKQKEKYKKDEDVLWAGSNSVELKARESKNFKAYFRSDNCRLSDNSMFKLKVYDILGHKASYNIKVETWPPKSRISI